MELQLQNIKKMIAVSETVFASDYIDSLVHQLFVAYLAGASSGTKAQKNRSAVRGGGAKPWNQKGGGRARAGTIRSPLWRSGGVTFAAQTKDHSQKLNKKMYRACIRSIFSELVRSERLKVVDDITVDAPKTKQLLAKLNELGVTKTLIVTETADEKLYLSARNLPYVEVSDVDGLSHVSLVAYEKVVSTVGAVRAIDEWLS